MHKELLLFMALCGLHFGNGVIPKNLLHDLDNRYGADELPEQCKGENYCTIKPANYDQARYNRLFNNTNLEGPMLIKPLDSLDNRIDEDAGDDCDVDVTYEPLYKIRSKAGDWHTVIQAPDKNYLQQVRLEKCLNTNTPCFQGLGDFPEIETGCLQKYSVWQFYVDDGKGGMEKIETELPICCSCRYKVKYNNRRGKNFGKQSWRN